jgi:ABC-2 type transport system permease protein
MLWCLLQPTLTMALLYFVFSYFFKNRIENFPVYLITGTVFYQFFTETTTTAMQSIQANSGLIAKVKIPLWTYPATRAVASLVNFGLALVPLMAVVLATRTPLRAPAWLLAYSTLTMLGFAMGVGFFLSSLAVLFHDMVFLWRFACQLAMYATPIFYPDTMLMQSGGQLMLYVNPLYHYIHFSRTLLIEGAVPEWQEFAACALFAVVALGAGVWVFHSLKNKFVQYL